MIPLAGKLASVFPLRWVYQIAFVIFLVGSVICGAAKGSDLFIFGRAVAGIGAAGIASGGLTVIVTISTPAKRPLFIGITSSMFALGVILAPIIGGALTEKVSWRWCFYINLPPGGVTLLIMYFFFRPRLIHADEPIAKRIKRLDIIGALIFVPASFMLLIAMQWGGTRYPWNSATVIGLFVGGGVLTLIFIAWQWHQGDDALIPGTIVGRRNVALTCMFSFCFLGGLAVMSYYLPEWFQAVRGVSPLESGVRVLPSVITQILALLVVGAFGMFTRLSRSTHRGKVWSLMTDCYVATKLGYFNPWTIAGPILMSIAAGLFTTFKAFGTEPREWIGYQVIQGIGVGITMQVPTLIMQQTLDGHPMLPIGVSMLLFSQYLGATVNQVIAGSVFNAYLRSSLEDRGVNDRQIAQLLAGGTIHVEETAKEYFPELLKPVLESYNHAITRVYVRAHEQSIPLTVKPYLTLLVVCARRCELPWSVYSAGSQMGEDQGSAHGQAEVRNGAGGQREAAGAIGSLEKVGNLFPCVSFSANQPFDQGFCGRPEARNMWSRQQKLTQQQECRKKGWFKKCRILYFRDSIIIFFIFSYCLSVKLQLFAARYRIPRMLPGPLSKPNSSMTGGLRRWLHVIISPPRSIALDTTTQLCSVRVWAPYPPR